MKIEFTGRHIEVTPAIKAHVEDHFKRIDHIFDGKPATAHVIIEVERGRHRSEIVINWRNEVLTAESTDSDMYLSLSQTVSKIEKQGRKLKDKVIDKSRKGAKASAVVSTPPDVAEKVVSAKRIIESPVPVKKPMAPEEAIMMMEQRDQQFLVFRNSEGGKAAVIFKREDGHYGLIQA